MTTTLVNIVQFVSKYRIVLEYKFITTQHNDWTLLPYVFPKKFYSCKVYDMYIFSTSIMLKKISYVP